MLMEYARTNISEKAAVPKRIILIDMIPLTTIDKIFKPALCLLQIEDAFGEIVRSHSPLARVRAVNSKESGYLAEISGMSESDQHTVSQLLSEFSVQFKFID